MADALQPGDVVRLKSGGPKMTVTRVGAVNGVQVAFVAWFVAEKAEETHFAVAALEK